MNATKTQGGGWQGTSHGIAHGAFDRRGKAPAKSLKDAGTMDSDNVMAALENALSKSDMPQDQQDECRQMTEMALTLLERVAAMMRGEQPEQPQEPEADQNDGGKAVKVAAHPFDFLLPGSR